MFAKSSLTIMFCRDLEAMTEFYRDRLGMKTLAQKPGEQVLATEAGDRLILQEADNPRIELAFTHVEVEQARTALADLNPNEMSEHEDGRGFQLRDPEGNAVNFVNH